MATDYFIGSYRTPYGTEAIRTALGPDLKKATTYPGNWRVYMYMQGETIPKAKNHVRLSETEKDQWESRCW